MAAKKTDKPGCTCTLLCPPSLCEFTGVSVVRRDSRSLLKTAGLLRFKRVMEIII
ncbi:hypothetical protein DPMN_014023 [Dreissena polymorpha]|uniref:Uncharacterized protein n=1 Tax=Dreissena polymorpha TaxID=45954 RepID=A0A9D4N8F0_DREPO|nr:hypothetical protein DPMN_014023 [Dreissena polymorpha]